MSGLSRDGVGPASGASADGQGFGYVRPAMRAHAAAIHRNRMPDTPPALPAFGCSIVRRVTDDRGRGWRVRQLWTMTGQALLFQCEVAGVRSEVRPVYAPLDLLRDDDLVGALAMVED